MTRKFTLICLFLLFILVETSLVSVYHVAKPIFVNDVGSAFDRDVARLGPPYVAYDFNPPLISGILFSLASWWTDDPFAYHLAVSSVLGILWLLLIALTLRGGKRIRWTFYWFLAPSFLVLGFFSWDAIPAVFTALSTILLATGMVGWSAFALALASSSSFYPPILLPIYLLKAGKKKRIDFALGFSISFICVNFPFVIVNPQRWLDSYLVNILDVWRKSVIWHLHPFLSQYELISPLLTLIFFSAGYCLIFYRNNGKSLSQLILIVLSLFLLINGIYTPTANLWILPFIGLVQPNPILFLSFDLASVSVPFLQLFSFSPVQLLVAVMTRSVLLIPLLAHLWVSSPPEISPIGQYARDTMIRFEGCWKGLRGRLVRSSTPTIIVSLSVLASIVILPNLGEPPEIYFDEYYYVNAAKSVLRGEGDPNWIQPPLGKLLMALGMIVLGEDNPLAWRLPGAFLAIACVPALYSIGSRLSGSRKTGFIASLLFCFDFLFFSMARIALLDIYVLAFSLFGILFYLSWQKSRRLGDLALFSVSFGLAFSSKLMGLLPLSLCLFHGMSKWRRGRRYLIGIVIAFIIVPVAIYLASYVPCFFVLGYGFSDFLDRQYWLFYSSAYLPGEHPYMSEPWTWPFMLRPLLSFYEGYTINGVDYVAQISHLGNPVIWYIGTIVVIMTVFDALQRRRGRDVFISSWFLLTWLFYFPLGIAHVFFEGGRAQYIYYFLQSVPALCIALANLLEESDRTTRFPISVLVLAAALVSFGLCYPVISGYPITVDYARGVKLLR